MIIKRGENTTQIPNWLVLCGLLVVDNVLANGFRIVALKKSGSKKKDSQ